MAAEVGDQVSALRHFEHAAAVDLADAAGNTADGVHLAAAGGLWMGLVYGFGGFRHHRGRFTLDPHLPSGWDRLRFRLRLHGVPAVIDLTQEAVAVAVEGGELALSIRGEPVVVRPGPPAVIRL
jgi:alpha,alpha-trehalose phosphorylase